MSDSRKRSEGHSSSDDENKMKETSNVSDSEDSKTSTSSQSASDSEAAAKAAFIRSNPILYGLLQLSLRDLNPLLVAMLNSSPTSSNEARSVDLQAMRRNFISGYSHLKEKNTKKSLKRNFVSVSETALDKSEASRSDEYSLPAKKPLFDESIEKVLSPLESQASTSKTHQTHSDILPGSTGNLGSSASNIIAESTKYKQDSKIPASSTESHTSKSSRQEAMPSTTGHQISGELHSAIVGPSSSVRSENDDSTPKNSNATAREQGDEGLNGARPPDFSGIREIQNILHLFEYLLNEFYILESYIDEQQVIPRETPADEGIAVPSCSSKASDRQLATISAKSVAGSKQTQTTCSDCDKVNAPEKESETHANLKGSGNEKEPLTSGDATAIQECTIDTSLGEPSNLDLSSMKGAKPNPKVENLDRPTEILPALQLLIAEAQNLLFQCIEATEGITRICHEQGASRPHREIESHIANILDKLHQLVQIRKECTALFEKCRNRNEIAGVTCILEVKTHIAQAYNRLLNDVLALKDLFHQNNPSKPQSDSDD